MNTPLFVAAAIMFFFSVGLFYLTEIRLKLFERQRNKLFKEADELEKRFDEKEKRLQIAYLINKYKDVADPAELMNIILDYGTRNDFSREEYTKLIKATRKVECQLCEDMRQKLIKKLLGHDEQ